MTFEQAKILVNAISFEELINTNKVIIDLEKASPWDQSAKCYLKQDVFKRETMSTEKRNFCHRYVQLKYLEANSPRATVAHRIEPLTGCIAAQMKKRPRSDDNVQMLLHPEVEEKCRNYQRMLHNLLAMISYYLKLSCPIEELLQNQYICIWLDDILTEH